MAAYTERDCKRDHCLLKKRVMLNVEEKSSKSARNRRMDKHMIKKGLKCASPLIH